MRFSIAGGNKKVPEAPKPTQEELDRQMDEYMFKDKPVRVVAEERTGESCFLLNRLTNRGTGLRGEDCKEEAGFRTRFLLREEEGRG